MTYFIVLCFSFANSGVSDTIIFCLVADIVNMSNSDDSCYSSLSEDEIIVYGLGSGLDKLSLSSSMEVQCDSTENDDTEADECGYQTDESCLKQEGDDYDDTEADECGYQADETGSEQEEEKEEEGRYCEADQCDKENYYNNDVGGIQSDDVASETNSGVSDAVSNDVEMLELTQAACCNDNDQCIASYDVCN